MADPKQTLLTNIKVSIDNPNNSLAKHTCLVQLYRKVKKSGFSSQFQAEYQQALTMK